MYVTDFSVLTVKPPLKNCIFEFSLQISLVLNICHSQVLYMCTVPVVVVSGASGWSMGGGRDPVPFPLEPYQYPYVSISCF